MNTKEFFLELSAHKFNCYAFMALAESHRSQVYRVLRVLTDSELEELTTSFEDELNALKDSRAPQQELQIVFTEYDTFINKKHLVQEQRKSSYPSCSSEVIQLLCQKYPLQILVLLAVNSCFQSNQQPFDWKFWVAFGVITVIFLLVAIDIILKWKYKENPQSYEDRLQKKGLFSCLKNICGNDSQISSQMPPNSNVDVNGIAQQNAAEVVQEAVVETGEKKISKVAEEKVVEMEQEQDGKVEEKKKVEELQMKEEKVRRVFEIQLAGINIHEQTLTKSLLH